MIALAGQALASPGIRRNLTATVHPSSSALECEPYRLRERGWRDGI